MNRRGFTIVELVVVMTIMAILLALGLVGFANSQANARDAERSADIDAISNGLEARYARGNPYATATYINQGGYPNAAEFRHAEGVTVPTITPNTAATPYLQNLLPGTSAANFAPPGVTGAVTATFIAMCLNTCGAAEDATRINSTVTAGVYVYEPVNSANQVCIIDTECVRYNLYYKQEGSGGTIVKVSSKRQ